MTKRQKRMLAIAVVLTLLLVVLVYYFNFYRQTKTLKFNVIAEATGSVTPPQFMYSFSGTGGNRLQRPVGVLVTDKTVYVADSVRGKVFKYDLDGNLQGAFEGTHTANPLYLAQNPKTGNIYVSDRTLCALQIFTPQGKFVSTFDPNLPKAQRPKFKTYGVKWQPLAVAFAPDGTLYVTEILNGHRLLVFGPDGKFRKSVGTAGMTKDPMQGSEVNQFPNGLLVIGKELYMADSNNQRVKVYDLNGNFKRIIVTNGLPRGLALLDRFPADPKNGPARFVEVDTLAHDATIWTAKGDKILSFGEQGFLDGQFSYPDGISRGPKNKVYIADSATGRIQVWGWPAQAASIPTVTPKKAAWCLLPLLLLPLLLLLRKKTYFATADFVDALIAKEMLELLKQRRVNWVTTELEYEKIKLLEAPVEFELDQIFAPVEYSESDVQALMDKYELDHEMAVTLNTASRTKLACTDDDDLRRLAKLLEVHVMDSDEFVEEFDRKRK
ncbi:MAG: hypothetical protein ACM3VW_05525 [Bacteroidota bacterium]